MPDKKIKELTVDQKIKAERKELNVLVSKGIEFDLNTTAFQRKKGLLGLLGQGEIVKKTVRFKIQEPTLSTLDRLSCEQIDLIVDEKQLSSDIGLAVAKKLTNQHARRMAKIIAIAVIGQDYLIPVQNGYENDQWRLEELTDLFFHNIKPSKLLELTLFINSLSNLGDFCHSIRLMSAERTTMPIRIEKED